MVDRILRHCAAISAVLCLSALLGCSGTLGIFGDDRSRSKTIADTEIELNINKRLLAADNRDLFFNVSSDSFEGRVMLTGSVPSEADKLRAGRMVNGLPNVRELYNHLIISSKRGLANKTNDAWIDTKIRSQLITRKNIKWLNYRWRVVGGTVYLLGRAQNKSEKNDVMKILRQTTRVRGIVDHVVNR
jgi:osmotically-inducible protein OsmY